VSLHKRLLSAGGRLVVRNMQPVVREVLFRLHLNRVFEIAEDAQETGG
jgi:anti-anti-sigma regulatory factor